MIHRMDPPADPDREPMPERIVPMLAQAVERAPARRGRTWSFEVKWDGVRAIAYVQPGRLRLESRNLNDITDAYPEVRGLIGALGMHEAVLDGEIVAFDENGRPSFERLQRRMHVDLAQRRSAGWRAARRSSYAIFDLLYLDGHSLMDLPYDERRARAGGAGARRAGVAGAGRPPRRGHAAARGDAPSRASRGSWPSGSTRRYEPGRRSGAWLKIKHTSAPGARDRRLDPGRGPAHEPDRRAADGLLRGRRSSATRGASAPASPRRRSTTLRQAPRAARRDDEPVRAAAGGPEVPREAVFVEPAPAWPRSSSREWTAERMHARAVVQGPARGQGRRARWSAEVVGAAPGRSEASDAIDPNSPEALFDEVERGPEGALRGAHRGPRAEDHQLGQGALPARPASPRAT